MGKRILQLQMFTAFRSRNYRLYVYGQSISLMGTWMQRTAVSWVVYMLTHNTFMLSLAFLYAVSLLFADDHRRRCIRPLQPVQGDAHHADRVVAAIIHTVPDR